MRCQDDYNPAMLLFDPDALLDFPRYGIAIPALDSRKIRTLEALKILPSLTNRQSEWLVESFSETTTLEDLLRVNENDYARGFFDSRAAGQLKSAYELVNPDGSYNRWDPDSAISPLEDMVPSLMRMLAGTRKAGEIALSTGFCHYLGGGAHHGHYSFGHGFCPLNDTAIAIRRLQADGKIRRAWVIDVDAHKGDGTAALFADDQSIFTLSAHMAHGWPLDDSIPAGHPSRIPSNLDIDVDSGEEDQYLERLQKGLLEMKERSDADIVFVLAGADPWEGDQLPSTGPLKLSMEQMKERDQMIWNFLDQTGIPSAWLTAGGYGDNSWQIHTAFLSWILPQRLG